LAEQPKALGEPGDLAITLGVLKAVQANSAITQRSVAGDLGIALGLANAYLKRCVKKGYIKIRQVPPNRFAYYLTPQGFSEKSRLTARFLSQSLHFFREARTECGDILGGCADRGWTRIALVGAGDLAEIAILCAAEHAIDLVAVVDLPGTVDRVHRVPVVRMFPAPGTADALLVTDMAAPQETFEAAKRAFPPVRVLVPDCLNVARDRPELAE